MPGKVSNKKRTNAQLSSPDSLDDYTHIHIHIHYHTQQAPEHP
jgi:hypothetical protein